jgi:hypothetical protein
MGPLNSRPTAPRKVDGPPIFRESNPNERDSNYRGVSFLLLAAGNANVCGLHKESRLKFTNATELDGKVAGKTIGSRLSTNEASLQASELFLCIGDMHGCDDTVVGIPGSFVVLSPGDSHLQPLR